MSPHAIVGMRLLQVLMMMMMTLLLPTDSEAFCLSGAARRRPLEQQQQQKQQRGMMTPSVVGNTYYRYGTAAAKQRRTTALSISLQRDTERNFYSILQVNRKANDAEIKLAYRRLAKIYHPGTLNDCESKQASDDSWMDGLNV
jgi:hypothetical protein